MKIQPSKLFLKITLLVVLFSFSLSCNKKEEDQGLNLNPVVEKYLDELLLIMKTNSINKKTINWVNFEKQVKTKALAAKTIEESFTAIQTAISSLNDNHSAYFAKNGKILSGFASTCPKLPIGLVEIPTDKVGYIKIESFSGSGDASKAQAEYLQTQIKNLDKTTLKGWIVDLRGNLGGNMWPMLAGVGPILSNGICGAFIDPDSVITQWSYNNGIASNQNYKIVEVSNPYKLLNTTYKVAVLTDNATASSGEAIAVAFKNAPNSKSFGLRTCGISTANVGYTLSDGATLNLTVSTMADRTLKKYGSYVLPDVEEAVAAEQIKKAVSWIIE